MSELIVFLAGERVGRLRLKDNGNMQFHYDEGYAGPRISQAMPVQAEAHPHAACRAVFGGLLLEGDARDWLIGNCDAHGKNYSLLYDSGAPTLAPLYDLVSTTSYARLTTRLAMSIDGARSIEEVDGAAWSKLAAQAGLGDRFQRETRVEMAERAVNAAKDLVETGAHAEEVVDGVLAGLVKRGEKVTQEASR